MSLKENLKEELQKLRLSREKPGIRQVNQRAKKEKANKTLSLAAQLLADIEETK